MSTTRGNSVLEYYKITRGGSRIPRRRGRHPSRRGRQHTNMPDFSQKLHEIKKILVRRGVHAEGAPLGSATDYTFLNFKF